MKVLIIGANGLIGKMITEQLHAMPGYLPTALIRKEEQRITFEELGIPTKLASLEGSVQEIATAMEGHDAIVFTAGSGSKTGPDKTLTVDLDGAVKAMEAAEKVGIRRFVMISALRVDDRDAWEHTPIKPYLVAKHYADRVLKGMDLDYTILRPGRLFNEPGTGKITTENPTVRRGVPREDVATLTIDVLGNPKTFKKIIEFNEGDQEIAEVISSLA